MGVCGCPDGRKYLKGSSGCLASIGYLAYKDWLLADTEVLDGYFDRDVGAKLSPAMLLRNPNSLSSGLRGVVGLSNSVSGGGERKADEDEAYRAEGDLYDTKVNHILGGDSRADIRFVDIGATFAGLAAVGLGNFAQRGATLIDRQNSRGRKSDDGNRQ